MSSRYPPAHDIRYPPPRGRSRSPHRHEGQGWRSSGPSNPGFNNRYPEFGRGGPEPPRGPRTFSDSSRAPGPGPGAPAPLGPRGRGAPPRPEFRELRDAPPLGTDRSFRDREFDRRPRPVSPRPRSPQRNFRDALPPRDLDIARSRRDSRDGPLPVASTYPERAPFGQPGVGRGGFGGRGRGRGRGDFDFRDRGRRGPIDERPAFGPRDRSPPPRWGSLSRPEREDWRPERREEDRWLDREDREREGDRFRKDPIAPSRFEPRLANEGPTRTPTPHQPVGPSAPPPAERTSQLDQPKDDQTNRTRRFSTSTLTSAVKEPRREPLPSQADLLAGRVESSSAKYGSRASSPPPPGPQVPAFGSFSIKPSVYSGPTSNVWKAPPDNRSANPPARGPAPPTAPSPVAKTVPTAPKAQLNAPPLAAPRAPRALEGAAPAFNENPNERVPAAPKSWNTGAPQPPIPTGPWALRGDERNANQFAQQPPSRDGRSLSSSHQPNVPSVPVSPRISHNTAKQTEIGPSPSGSVQSLATASENGIRDVRPPRQDNPMPRSGTPPPSAPSGPRRTHSFSTSPTLHSPNIPTAPKAIRGPPVAPRGATERGIPPSNRPPERASVSQSRAPPNAPRAPAWNQWIRPGAPIYREPTVPAKRDANGDEKMTLSRSHASPALQSGRRVSEPSSVKIEDNLDDSRPRNSTYDSDWKTEDRTSGATGLEFDRRVVEEQDLEESPEYEPPQSIQETMPDVPLFPEDTSEDDAMDLDEEDFAQSKAKFERQKADLESQLIDLSARQYRAATPLEQIARLSRISEHDLSIHVMPSPTIERSILEVDDGLKQHNGQHREKPSSATEEDEQQKLLTPKQEDLEDQEDLDGMGEDDPLDDMIPAPIPSRELFNLPYLVKSPLTPLSDRGALFETLARHEASKSAMTTHFAIKADDDSVFEQDLDNEYKQTYRQWTRDLRMLDRSREEKERDDRQASIDPAIDFEATYSALDMPMVESSRSRLHKFSSEYDIQKVLKESEETARIEQERLDRESKKIQADMEKEAVIPDVFDEAMRQRRIWKNNNRYRSASRLTDIFGYEPPRDNFTEEEHKKFLDLFKDRPKKWGEIATKLPGRSYADCIHHYYAFKWDGRFRETKAAKRKGRGGRGRGGKAARTRGSALMADLSRTDEEVSNPSAFTETGRPRRAATRTTYGEKEPDTKGVAVSATLGKKSAPATESGTEKPAKRRKAANGEKGVKRGRQPLAAAPVASPSTYDKENVATKEELARAQQSLEEASLLTGLQAGRRGVHADSIAMFAQENLSQPPVTGDSGDRNRQGGQPTLQRSSASSYWSVPEQTDFIKFISHFGTDFAGIATHMGTKTQTMVKNHYLRLIADGQKEELAEAAAIANARRDRGENMGLPPTPTPITKRRYDNPPTLPRSMVASGEFMDIDEPITSLQPTMQVQPQSSQYPQPPRFMTPSQPAATPQQRVVSNPTQTISSPVPSKQLHQTQARQAPPPGPRMGFFSESSSRLDRRPTVSSLQSGGRSVQQPLGVQSPQQQDATSQPSRLPPDGVSSEYMESLERERNRALNLQTQALHERNSQDRVPQMTPHTSAHQPSPSQFGRSLHSGMPERRNDVEERPGTPASSAPLISRQAPSMFRNVIGSPASAAQSPVVLHPSFRPAQINSPPKREEYRPGSVPAPSPAQSVTNLAPPAPPAETRKTSNVMSLLNSEPEEPRTTKTRMSDQSASTIFSRAQSPAPQSLGAGYPRREVFNSTPASRSDFERPSFSQPAAHVPTPPLPHERLAGGTMTPGGSRPDWAGRPPTSQPPLSSSPHPPTPLSLESRSYFPSHRASILSGLNPQARHVPSPPPNSSNPYLQRHSRTPSLSHSLNSAQGQSQGMQRLQQAQQSASQNPSTGQATHFSQHPGSTSHMQQIQAQEQNQMRHAHNVSLGSAAASLHQRQVPAPDEEYYQRQREHQYHEDQLRQDYENRQRMDRQRESEAHFQAQQQARQQEQRHFGQYQQGPPPSVHSPHPQPYQAQGMSLREQSMREAHTAMQRDAMHRDGQMYQTESRENAPPIARSHFDEEERYRYAASMRDNAFPGGRPPGYPRR